MTSSEFYVGLAVIAVLWILTLMTWHATYEDPEPRDDIEDATYYGGTE